MTRIELSKATRPLSEYAQEAEVETIVLTVRGKPRVAVVRLNEDADWESLSLSLNPTFQRIIEDSRRSVAKHGVISTDEMRRRLETAKKVPPTKKRKRAS